jgi:hypothetical protein
MIRRIFRTAAILTLSLSIQVLRGQEMHSPVNSSPAFDQLKSLAGTWEGKKGSDALVQVTYEVFSNGSVVMERMQPAKEAEMITIYSLDGHRLVVTHYCSVGNQPTMQTGALTGATGKYDFHFVRVAGTKTPDEGHMVTLSLTIPDKDHFTQVWTFKDRGKSNSETFVYSRKQ